jgi:hypothetical protein
MSQEFKPLDYGLDVSVVIEPRFAGEALTTDEQSRRLEASEFFRGMAKYYEERLKADLLDKIQFLIEKAKGK